MVCGAYDSKYPQFGHRNVVTGMTLSLFSTLRPVQKPAGVPPETSFVAAIHRRCYPAPNRTPCGRDTLCIRPCLSYSSPKESLTGRANYIPRRRNQRLKHTIPVNEFNAILRQLFVRPVFEIPSRAGFFSDVLAFGMRRGADSGGLTLGQRSIC